MGSTVPADIWRSFMVQAEQGQPMNGNGGVEPRFAPPLAKQTPGG